MPAIQTPEGKKADTSAFDRLYTQSKSGVYVRNSKPSSGVMTRKRLADNMRTLLDNSPPGDESE